MVANIVVFISASSNNIVGIVTGRLVEALPQQMALPVLLVIERQ